MYSKWMAMPEEFRAQFDQDALKSCMPKPDELYCLPYTGFGSLLFRNLTVLEKAGIDTTKPPATWDEWFAQMKKVKDAGMFAIPDETLVFNSIAEIYATSGGTDSWGFDWANRKTEDRSGDDDQGAAEIRRHEAARQRYQPQRPGRRRICSYRTSSPSTRSAHGSIRPTRRRPSHGLKYDYRADPWRCRAGKTGGVRATKSSASPRGRMRISGLGVRDLHHREGPDGALG